MSDTTDPKNTDAAEAPKNTGQPDGGGAGIERPDAHLVPGGTTTPAP